MGSSRRLRFLAIVGAMGTLGLAWAANASAIQVGGVDPDKEPIPGATFACYQETAGDSYAAPTFTLQIGPGRAYSTPSGGGTFSIKPNEILSVTWDTGPLAGDDIPSTVFFGDWGQSLSLEVPNLDSECYQTGARHQVALLDFARKDPEVASYPCADRATGAAAGTFEVMAGRTYSFGGTSGAYTVDILGDINRDFSSIDFTSGPLAGETAFYERDGDTGLRDLSLNTSPRLVCRSLGAATPRPRFGPGRAPKPPKGSGGLNGLYAGYQIDVANVCGGLCWKFRYFKPNGYVYTREPETGLGDADCTRNKPNGLPLCEVYRRRGNTLIVGDDAPAPFAAIKNGVRINGTRYRRVAPSPRLKLRGKYRSFSFTPQIGGGTGGVAVERAFTFTTTGRFTRQGFVGGSFVPLPGTGGASVVTTSSATNAGTYRVVGGNSMEFRYLDGSRRRVFFFLPDGPTRSVRPPAIRIGGNDYLPK